MQWLKSVNSRYLAADLWLKVEVDVYSPAQAFAAFFGHFIHSATHEESHQFLTHVNAPFQYFMFLYGVLTIEHGNGGHILLSYFLPATPSSQQSLHGI